MSSNVSTKTSARLFSASSTVWNGQNSCIGTQWIVTGIKKKSRHYLFICVYISKQWISLTFQLQTLDRMSGVWNPSHSTTPNEQVIRGILCSSYAQIQYIFKGMQIVNAYWEVRKKLLGDLNWVLQLLEISMWLQGELPQTPVREPNVIWCTYLKRSINAVCLTKRYTVDAVDKKEPEIVNSIFLHGRLHTMRTMPHETDKWLLHEEDWSSIL